MAARVPPGRGNLHLGIRIQPSASQLAVEFPEHVGFDGIRSGFQALGLYVRPRCKQVPSPRTANFGD